jgi:competence ComEA-like helix-hairpin-helix protein
MWQKLTSWFQFSRREQAVVLFLLALVVAGMGVRAYRSFGSVTQTDFDEQGFRAAVEKLRVTQDSLAVARADSLRQNPDTAPATAADVVLPLRHEPEKNVSGPMDINTASAAALAQLPRIGPRMAERIVAYRREQGVFTTVDDLRKVKGIGEKTFEKLRPLIVVKQP